MRLLSSSALSPAAADPGGRSMNKRLTMLALGLAIFTAAALADTPARAAADLTLRAASVQGTAGDLVDVAIDAAGTKNIAALELNLLYDSDVLAFDSLAPGALDQG